MILLALAATLICPPGTKQARVYGKPSCVAVKAVAVPAPRPRDPQGLLRQYANKRLWWNAYPDKPIDGYVVEKTKAICPKTCVVFGRASKGNTARDLDLTRSAPASRADDIDAGIRVGGGKGQVPTDDVLIERVYSHGWQMAKTLPGYQNGDGITINRDVVKVTVRDGRFEDNADAGIDSKADLTIIDNVSASGNGHAGVKLWNPVMITGLICEGNGWACILAMKGARVTASKVTLIGPEPLVSFDNADAVVTLTDCPDLSRWTGKVLSKGRGKLVMPVGCKLK